MVGYSEGVVVDGRGAEPRIGAPLCPQSHAVIAVATFVRIARRSLPRHPVT